MNTDLTITFKTALTLCVVAALKRNQLLIFTALYNIYIFHYIYCHHYINIRLTLLNSITEIIGNTFIIADKCLVNLLPFDSRKYTKIEHSHKINATIKYMLDSEGFSSPHL